MNFLEQLAAEWLEYQGYFVRRNTLVGVRKSGGWECELDVVAFHPTKQHLIHMEPSMDAHSWAQREKRYQLKFAAGRKYIPFMFAGVAITKEIDQVALFGLGKKRTRETLGGGRVQMVEEFLREITNELKTKRIEREAVPESFPLLRTIQFVCQHSKALFRSEA